MSRIAAIDPRTATGEAKALLDAVQARLGVTPNFIRVLAHAPKALEGFLGLHGAAAGFNLDPATQERIALAVAEAHACQYCVSAHTAIGRGAGLSNEEMLLNRRHAFDPGTQYRLGQIAAAVQAAAGQATSTGQWLPVQQFQQAAQWHTERFPLNQIQV